MNTTKKIILVPIDFSTQSLIALNHAEEMSHAFKGEIYILHVSEEQSLISSLFSSDHQDKMHEEVWKKMSELALSSETRSNVRTTPLVASGKIYEEIVRAAELVGATFIIMGTNGADGKRKRFIGSKALRVVRESRIPVISIKGQPAFNGIRSIVLPLDLSKETREKVNKAIEFSRYFNATIHVFSVFLTDNEEVVSKLQLQMAQVKNFLSKANVEHTIEMIIAQDNNDGLGQEVIRYAKQVNGDLIMIMTQQETNFTEMFVGSAAQEVISSSEIPVCSIIPTVKKDMSVFVPY
jgi:nucleotide-binding universal stress UspA family protein